MDTRSVYIQCPTETWKPKPYDWYRWRFVAVWLVPISLFIGTLIVVPWSIVSFTVHDGDLHERGVWMLLLGLFFLVFVLWMRSSATQLRFRAGMGFFSGMGGVATDAAPFSPTELVLMTQRFRVKGILPRVVGGAWSNVLRMETSYGPRLHMRRMVGRVPNLPLAWYAGTELMTINKELRKRGLQLLNVPTYGCVTVGAWVATQGHGMPGRAFSHAPITVKAKVIDLLTGIETEDGPDMLLDKFGQGLERAQQFLILWVSLEGSPTLVPNRQMLRQGRWLKTIDDAAWVNRKDAQAAVLFVGGSNTLALTWQPHMGDDVRGGGVLMDLGISMFAVVGWGLSDPSGPGRDRTELLEKVPGFFHFYLSPVYVWFFLLLGVMNAEFYTSDLSLTPELTLKLCAEIQQVYKRHTGRCELRFLGKLTYFDLFAVSTETTLEVLRVLANNGVTRITQHSGKYQLRRELVACAGLQLASVYEVAR